MDIDAIGPGVDYARLIDDTIDTVEVVIVVIGQQWLTAQDGDGVRRLDDPQDLVRQEVSVALARGVLVIPVLVQGATLPQPEDLPADLAGLARHNAFEISDGRWNYDADRLVQAVEQGLTPATPTPAGSAAAGPEVEREVVESKPTTKSLLGSTPVILAVSGALLVLLFGLLVGPTWHNEQIWFRIVVALAVIILTAIGLGTGRWRLVMMAGVTGLAGFVIWMLMLIGGGHELFELMSLQTDGVTNALFLVGSGLVLTGGGLGARSTAGQAQHA
jgi:hypothetical protein